MRLKGKEETRDILFKYNVFRGIKLGRKGQETLKFESERLLMMTENDVMLQEKEVNDSQTLRVLLSLLNCLEGHETHLEDETNYSHALRHLPHQKQ